MALSLLSPQSSRTASAAAYLLFPPLPSIRYNHVSLVRMLVAHGADVNAIYPAAAFDRIGGGGGGRVLGMTVAPRYAPMSSVFIDVCSGSKDEYSMLLILEYLLRKGAFVHWRGIDASVETPIVGAMKGGFESCALLLLRHGSPTDVTIDGTSLLLKACQSRMEGFIDALLMKGVDLGEDSSCQPMKF